MLISGRARSLLRACQSAACPAGTAYQRCFDGAHTIIGCPKLRKTEGLSAQVSHVLACLADAASPLEGVRREQQQESAAAPADAWQARKQKQVGSRQHGRAGTEALHTSNDERWQNTGAGMAPASSERALTVQQHLRGGTHKHHSSKRDTCKRVPNHNIGCCHEQLLDRGCTAPND